MAHGQIRIGALVVGIWMGVLPFATMARVRVWQTDHTLWADAVLKAPSKPRCVMNDGRQHELNGDTVYAEAAYRKTIGLTFDIRRPDYVRRFSQAAAEVNIAHVRMKEGKLATAMEILETTLTQWPTFPYAHYNKGAILWVVGACEDARWEYDVAVHGDPALQLPKTPCVPSESAP